MNYQHIIWDWNGTVINDVKLCVRILNEALRHEKLPSITISQYRKKFSFPVNLFYKEIGLPSSGNNYKALNTFFISSSLPPETTIHLALWLCALRKSSPSHLLLLIRLLITKDP